MSDMRSKLILSVMFLVLANLGVVLADTTPSTLTAEGNYFAINDSEYLNVTLQSSELIKITLTVLSVPARIEMSIESLSAADSTQLLISGLAPLTTYYKYEGRNRTDFTTDENGSYTFIQDLTGARSILIQDPMDTINIWDDSAWGDTAWGDESSGWDCNWPENNKGVQFGIWNKSTKTCTLINDINESIILGLGYERDPNTDWLNISAKNISKGMTLNGNGHTVHGVNSDPRFHNSDDFGILIFGSNNTVENLKLSNYSPVPGLVYTYGITMNGDFGVAGNSRIINNTIFGFNLPGRAFYGVFIMTPNNLIENNTFESFPGAGMAIMAHNYTNILGQRSDGQIIRKNNILNSNIILTPNFGYGIYLVSNNNLVYNNNFINSWGIISLGVNNSANLAKPIGGNYYSLYDTPAENCTDANSDGFCDAPYNNWRILTDYLPWTQMNGWPQTTPLDSIPPMTAIALSGTLGNNDWYTSDVLVTLTAADNEGGSGVSKTEYGLDNLVWSVYTLPFTLSTDGAKTVYYRSTDNAGNVETAKSRDLKIDETKPVITIDTPIQYGLYTVGTALAFSGSDLMSGISTVVGTLTDTVGIVQNVETGYVPAPGVYTLVVRACDKASNCQNNGSVNFVVYDPEGGFATGGGWINPDADSTLPNGKASFGFVAKYLKGKSTGNLEFQYNDADINLKSTIIDWLVISGVSAQFQGTGTINGGGLYTFRVMAKDNAEPGVNADLFDIKVWTGTNTNAEPMHKTKNTIAGGNIIVHKK